MQYGLETWLKFRHRSTRAFLGTLGSALAGIAEVTIQSLAPTSISQPATVLNDTNHCGHDFQCLLEEFSDAFTSGDPCSKPVIVNEAPNYMFESQYDPQNGRWIPFNLLNLLASQPLPYVSSRLVPQ